MMVGNSEVLYHKNDKLGFKAIGLHYKEKKFVMYFLLPNSNIDLRDVVSKMNGTTLRSITKDTKITDFTYLVPKMTLDSFTNLRPVLQVNVKFAFLICMNLYYAYCFVHRIWESIKCLIH